MIEVKVYIQRCQKTCQIAKEKVDQYVQVGDGDVDLRCIINPMKLRDMKNISDLAIFIEETKNKNLDVSNLIEINAMLALHLKNFKKEIEDFKKGDTTFYFDQNEDSGYDISNAQKTCQIAKEKVDQYVQVGEADDSNKNPILLQACLEVQKQEYETLEKTYRHAMNELERLQNTIIVQWAC